MKLTQKLFKVPLLLAVVALLLISAGCGGGGGGPKITLKIWHPFLTEPQMNPVISAFQARYPNVEILFEKKDIETYQADLLSALASGEGPDIFAINNSWVPKYKDKISAAPETTYNLKEYKDTFVDAIWKDLVINNKIYGTAMWVDALGLFYNKDLMGTVGISTPPKTWQELAEDVRAITQLDSSGYFYRSGVAMGNVSNVNRAQDILYLLMLQAGATPWSSDGQYPQFANSTDRNGKQVQPGVEALEFYTSFADPTSANYNWNADSDYSIDAFANGRAAYLYSYSYAHDLIRAKSPNLNYDVAKVPQFSLNGPNVNYANYFAQVVSKQSQNQKAAWEFLKFSTSAEVLEAFYKENKHPSSRRDLIEKQAQDLDIGVFASANLTAKTFYKADEPRFDKIIGDMIDGVVLRGRPPNQALTEAQSQAGQLTQVRK